MADPRKSGRAAAHGGSRAKPPARNPGPATPATADPVAWLRAAQRGDEPALAALVRWWYPRLHRTLARRLPPDEPLHAFIDDAVQVTLLRMVRSLGTCRARSVEELSGWVFAIVPQVVRDLARSELPRYTGVVFTHRLSETERASVVEDWVERSTRDEAIAAVAAIFDTVVAELGEKDHDVLYSRFVACETFAQVAARWGVGDSGVRMRYHRLLASLRDEFLREVESLSPALRAQVLDLVGEESTRQH